MKCLILAGGKGNSLWPLSREEYPKQFIQLKKHRSLLQETVARNIPFCDEFLIATNSAYSFIAEGQMKAFQGLPYRCILEGSGRNTAPAITIACMNLNPSELVYVVSADQIVEGTNYKEAILRGKFLAKKEKLVTFGTEALTANTEYGYIRYSGNQVLEFKEKPDRETAEKYIGEGDYLWNSGNFLFYAGVFLQEIKKHAPNIYINCRTAVEKEKIDGNKIYVSKKILESTPAVPVEKAVFEHSGRMAVVRSSFRWWDVGNFEIVSSIVGREKEKNVIMENCSDTKILNRTEHRLVVADGLQDIIVINTEDACYIGNARKCFSVKEILREHPDYKAYFENSSISYRPWGTYEILSFTSNYKVKKVTVYPGKSLTMHRHALRSEQWSVVKGTASVALDEKKFTLNQYESLQVPRGVSHGLANTTDEDLIIVEVSFGPQISEDDKEAVQEFGFDLEIQEKFVKCEPIFKDYFWGGTRLRDIYGKKCDYDTIAESWELSAHEAGSCRIASGRYQGKLFTEYLRLIGEEALGWKCQAFEKFPLLIKFIDARDKLSIQVHPDDNYALQNENEYGKNELWYVVDCDPGASIYYGLSRDISREELKNRIRDNTLTEVLNRVMVKPGDTFFVGAGMIHAIGAGILICEIQQSSNCTYRLCDYGRRDKFGNLRELHPEQAIAVADTRRQEQFRCEYPAKEEDGCRQQLLGECKYFTCVRYDIRSYAKITTDEASFSSIIILEGTGRIGIQNDHMDFNAADSFFVHAGRHEIEIEGTCSLIFTRL